MRVHNIAASWACVVVVEPRVDAPVVKNMRARKLTKAAIGGSSEANAALLQLVGRK